MTVTVKHRILRAWTAINEDCQNLLILKVPPSKNPWIFGMVCGENGDCHWLAIVPPYGAKRAFSKKLVTPWDRAHNVLGGVGVSHREM